MTSDVFNREHIKINLNFNHKNEVLDYIANLSVKLGISNEKEEVYKGLVEREKEFETCLGDGIAIPHTKSEFIAKPAILILKCEGGVKWGENEIAKVIIGLLTPKEQDGNTHLQLLASLSRKLIYDDFKNTLLESKDTDEIFTLIETALKG